MKNPPIIEQSRAEQSPVVSFCIPVYNNAEAAVKIVNGLLNTDETRFEVVVSDDASKDNAQELLSQIKDPRFRYFRNEKNLGAHKNWEHSLELGRGEWLYLVMGQDKMLGNHTTILIKQLEYCAKNNVTYVRDVFNKCNGVNVLSGMDAMINFLGVVHPTGSIFAKDIFYNIPERGRYFEISDMFPENYVRRDMLLKGKGAFINSGVNSGKKVMDMSAVVSGVEHDMNILDMYFAPKRRTQQFFEILDMVTSDVHNIFTETEINKFFKVNFYALMLNVSYLWFTWCSNTIQMSHYGQASHYRSMKELVSNIFKAYRDTKAHLIEKGIYTPKREKIMYWCMTKALIYSLYKAPAKRLLQPLGIWKILKEIKGSYP